MNDRLGHVLQTQGAHGQLVQIRCERCDARIGSEDLNRPCSGSPMIRLEVSR